MLIAFAMRVRVFMDQPSNTDLCASSTSTGVDYVLDPKPKRRYRRHMTRRKDIEKIPGSAIRAAREALELSQGELANAVHSSQQIISRIEKGEIKGGGTKADVISRLGLQLPRDNGTTTLSRVRAVVPGPLYDLPLFEPRAGEGGYMTVAKEAFAKVRRPEFIAEVESAYALTIRDDTMSPRFRRRERLYINP